MTFHRRIFLHALNLDVSVFLREDEIRTFTVFADGKIAEIKVDQTIDFVEVTYSRLAGWTELQQNARKGGLYMAPKIKRGVKKLAKKKVLSKRKKKA